MFSDYFAGNFSNFDINLGRSVFGGGLYTAYDNLSLTESGKNFYKNFHQYDESEAHIAMLTFSFIAPELLGEILIEYGSVALAAECVAVIEGTQEAIISVVDNEYYAVKATREISKIADRDSGPDGVQYSLRATTDGLYPCYNCTTGIINLNAGNVWKYGETTNPESRYTESFLKINKLERIDEFAGSQRQIKIAEKSKIYNYFLKYGQLPPGNKIFR